jgi:hypothetical protein
MLKIQEFYPFQLRLLLLILISKDSLRNHDQINNLAMWSFQHLNNKMKLFLLINLPDAPRIAKNYPGMTVPETPLRMSFSSSGFSIFLQPQHLVV